MYVFKRNNKWSCAVRRKGLGSIYKTFQNKSDAEKWGRSKERELDQGLFLNAANTKAITLRDLLIDYRENVSIKKKNYSGEYYRIERLIKHHLSKKYINALTVVDIRNLQDELIKLVSPSTVNKYIVQVSVVLNYAIKVLGFYLPFNVCRNIKRLNEPEFNETRVPVEDELKLLKAAEQSKLVFLKGMIMIAVDCGLRRGEIFKLNNQDVDLLNGTAKLKETKNGTSRTVGLSPRVINVIKNLPIGIDGRIFPIKSSDQFKNHWKRCKQLAGVKIRFHTLRHEFASRLFEKGWDIAEVATQGGWKDWKVLRRYTKISGNHLAKKMKNI